MLFGVTLFVGGMIAVVLLMKYLNTSSTASAQEASFGSITPLQYLPSKQLEDLNQTVKSMKPAGTFFTRVHHIDDSHVHMYRCQREGGLQYSAVDILNEGPNDVYFSVNTSDMPEAPLHPGQTINIDFRDRGGIDKLYFRCNSGENATVYLYVVK